MKYSIPCLLILAMATWAAQATHVNISISQHHSATNTAQLTDKSTKESTQLKSDAIEQFQNEGRSARIQTEGKDDKTLQYANHKTEGSEMKGTVTSSDSHMDRGHFVAPQPDLQYRSMYHMSPIEYQRNAQFRRVDEQQKQNMEFERYIHHYHSGPTVETVRSTCSICLFALDYCSP